MRSNRTKHVRIRFHLTVVAAALCGCAENDIPKAPEGKSMQAVELKSSAFAQNDTISKKYTGDGKNVSPPLSWSESPQGTKSWAIICDDPDAPNGTWVHWVLFNMPADAQELAEGVPADETLSNGAIHGRNDFGDISYGGPAPPKGKPHRYFFKLYALDTLLDLKPGTTKADVLKAMEHHVLGHGELMGTYQR